MLETIGQSTLLSFFDDRQELVKARNSEIRNGSGHRVGSFLELARKVAELQFNNPDHVLMFRGQAGDYLNTKQNTSLKPTLFRPIGNRNPSDRDLANKFQRLQRAEQLLVTHYAEAKFPGTTKLRRQRILRWSILQHYEVCPTPLLDVTHSLRIAASFGSLGAARESFIFVLGVPNLSGAITASAEAGLQIVRLSSVCPPTAMRPHIQEGYLLGEYPDMTDFEQKSTYGHYEIDFGRRLIAKFRFDPRDFWKDKNFPKIENDALYPASDKDPLFELAIKVERALAD